MNVKKSLIPKYITLLSASLQDFLQLLLENVTPECNDTRTIHYNKVRAFRLEPEETESGAYVTVDGELVGLYFQCSQSSPKLGCIWTIINLDPKVFYLE